MNLEQPTWVTRGELGIRTATLDREGIKRYRGNWVYLNYSSEVTGSIAKARPWRQAQG